MGSEVYSIREWEYLDLGQEKVKSLLSACPDYFTPSYRNGTFQAQAKQFVGTVVFADDTVVEVLPKIGLSDDDAKSLLEQMVRTVYLRPQLLDRSVSGTVKDSLLEYYIRMFCWEAEELFRKGVSHGYSRREENLSCVKGRILFSKDIKNNVADRSKVYVNHEIYSDDRPENRIVFATARLLQHITRDSENRRFLSTILSSFSNISVPSDCKMEFRKCTHDRSVQHYERILDICDVFLNGSHSVYSGEHVSVSLLFDMNVLFERYVAYWIRNNYPDAVVKTQDRGKKLFGTFGLKPDIVVDYAGKTYILDTKWKILEKVGDVSMDDVQQMYTYISEYNSSEAFLLYPKNDGIQNTIYSDGKRSLRLSFIDLLEPRVILPI